MDEEMSDKTLDARAGLNERSTGEIEHLVNLRQLSPNPVELVFNYRTEPMLQVFLKVEMHWRCR